MNKLSPERRKVAVMASLIAVFNMPALLVIKQLHDTRWLSVFVIAYATCMALLIAYTVSQLIRLKRSGR